MKRFPKEVSMHKNKMFLVFIFIIAIFAVTFSGCRDTESTTTVSNPSPSSTSQNPSSGSFGNTVKIKSANEQQAAEISFDGGGAKIVVGNKTIYSESKNTEKRKYFNGDTQICEVKLKDADGFKVRTTDGKLLWKVKISGDKIKISDNEENQNAFELKKDAGGAKIERNETKLGEAKFYADRQEIKVKDAGENKLFDVNAAKFSAAYAVLALNEIPEDLRYIILAELLSRNV